MFNYAIKTDLKIAPNIDTSSFAKRVALASLKCNVDKLDIDKLKSKVDKLDVDKLLPVPVDLSKLRDVVKNDFVKKDVYNTKKKILKIKYLALLTYLLKLL